jgi:hypothetical protein
MEKGQLQKTTVKIWTPLIDKLEQKVAKACLRRDAYLARVLAVEIPCLDAEVCLPNSAESHAFVAAQLDTLDRKPVSLLLPPDLTKSLNAVCKQKRIVRDAFFNRLFLLLAASPRVIDRLLFGFDPSWNWRQEVWTEYKHDGPFFESVIYPLEQVIDPFWAIRVAFGLSSDEAGLEEYLEPESGKAVRVRRDIAGVPVPPDAIYTTVFRQVVQHNSLVGLNCYLSDADIPGHAAQAKKKAALDNLLAELE